MMNTNKSRVSSSAPKISKKSSSSTSSVLSFKYQSTWFWLVYGILLAVLIVILTFILIKKRNVKKSPYDNKLVVNRFKNLYEVWHQVASDPMFLILAKHLMNVNNNIYDTSVGSKELLDSFNQLDKYVKDNLNFTHNVRITIIYTDGIVYYDSVIPISMVYFIKNGLPKPVNMYTLGSPLKDHNAVPEVANSIVSGDGRCFYTNLSGMRLTDPFYNKMISENFGFYERISSSLNEPYSYVARFLQTDIDKTTGFVNGFTLRIGIPIDPKYYKHKSFV